MANTPLRADSARCNNVRATEWQAVATAFETAFRACETLGEHVDDAQLEALTEEKHRALQAFYATPAPDAAALARKLEFFIEDDAQEYVCANDLLQHMLADARRLAKLEV